jgi:hypothetical protein
MYAGLLSPIEVPIEAVKSSIALPGVLKTSLEAASATVFLRRLNPSITNAPRLDQNPY